MDKKDLIVLVPDLDMSLTIETLLSLRTEALGIRKVSFTIERNIEKDSGCYRGSHHFLRKSFRLYHKALVLFDRHGSGNESQTREQLERDVETQLSQNGWDDRASAIVIDPELESWVWGDSTQIASILGWRDKSPDLSTWLSSPSIPKNQYNKPKEPKEVLHKVLRMANKRPSSSLFKKLALSVGFRNCVDPAFIKFKTRLQEWFPVDSCVGE